MQLSEDEKKKKTTSQSNLLNYSALERFLRATLPLVHQSQQIAVVNISDSTDWDIDYFCSCEGALE